MSFPLILRHITEVSAMRLARKAKKLAADISLKKIGRRFSDKPRLCAPLLHGAGRSRGDEPLVRSERRPHPQDRGGEQGCAAQGQSESELALLTSGKF